MNPKVHLWRYFKKSYDLCIFLLISYLLTSLNFLFARGCSTLVLVVFLLHIHCNFLILNWACMSCCNQHKSVQIFFRLMISDDDQFLFYGTLFFKSPALLGAWLCVSVLYLSINVSAFLRLD